MNKRKTNSSNFINETFLHERCVLNTVVKILAKRWVTEILLLVNDKICRFTEIKENLHTISDNVLAQGLNELVKFGILEKNIYQQVPLKVEYYLTESGKTLVFQLLELCNWGKTNLETTDLLLKTNE